jgi:hypothetical protein
VATWLTQTNARNDELVVAEVVGRREKEDLRGREKEIEEQRKEDVGSCCCAGWWV